MDIWFICEVIPEQTILTIVVSHYFFLGSIHKFPKERDRFPRRLLPLRLHFPIQVLFCDMFPKNTRRHCLRTLNIQVLVWIVIYYSYVKN